MSAGGGEGAARGERAGQGERTTRGVRSDDAGLSSVLGAVLLFGLLVSTLATIQVQYVPVWDHEREARLMDETAAQMAALKADLERQVANRTSSGITVPLPLAPGGGFSFFTNAEHPATLAYQPPPAGWGLRIDAPTLRVQGQDGVDLYVLSEQWQPVATGSRISGITDVDHLRIRILFPANLTSSQTVTAELRDAAGAYAGRISITNTDHGAEYGLRILVYSAASSLVPITEQMQTWKKQLTQQQFYLDALQPHLGFDAVLATATKPLNLTWTTTMANVQAALVYSTSAGRVGGAGLVLADFNHVSDGGRIVLDKQNQRFPAQLYTLEHGALLLRQPDGVAMVAAPAFDVRVADGLTTLSWSVPELAGAGGAVGGLRAAQVASTPLGPRLTLDAVAPRLNFTLATSEPAVWAAYFARELREAGLDSAAGHYSIATTPTAVTLQVRGIRPALADTVDDVVLDYQEARLAVSVLPSGG